MTKYRAKPITLDGHRFASRAEAGRYVELVKRMEAGEIAHLQLQPSFKFKCGARYIADFEYVVCATGALIFEDVKGAPTPVFRLKKKMLLQEFRIAVQEVRMNSKTVNLLIAAYQGRTIAPGLVRMAI